MHKRRIIEDSCLYMQMKMGIGQLVIILNVLSEISVPGDKNIFKFKSMLKLNAKGNQLH